MDQIERTFSHDRVRALRTPTHNARRVFLGKVAFSAGLVFLLSDMALAGWMLGALGGWTLALIGAAGVAIFWGVLEISVDHLTSRNPYDVKRRQRRINILLIPGLTLSSIAALLWLTGRTLPFILVAWPFLAWTWPFAASIGLALASVACFQIARLYGDIESLVDEHWRHRSELAQLQRLLDEWGDRWGSPFRETAHSLSRRLL